MKRPGMGRDYSQAICCRYIPQCGFVQQIPSPIRNCEGVSLEDARFSSEEGTGSEGLRIKREEKKQPTNGVTVRDVGGGGSFVYYPTASSNGNHMS